jgi:hypothetical protein
MAKFYACRGTKPLGIEVGSSDRLMFELKTYSGAIRKCERYYKGESFSLYRYINFYDYKTFKLIKG